MPKNDKCAADRKPTRADLDRALATLPVDEYAGKADYVVQQMRASFGDLFDPADEDKVRALLVARPNYIKPTIGRIVWFWKNPAQHPEVDPSSKQQPEAAKVVFVHNESLVNLRVYDHNGGACGVTSIPLRHAHEGVPSSSFCEWMPYQKGQAAKNEALEQANKLAGAQP